MSNWDVIVVGAGHNGLTCAAYLAEAGKRVLVLEERDRIGGACSIAEPWPGYRLSPCAYLCGLLHPRVIEDLSLAKHGYHWTPATAGMFVPFEDGSSIQLWEDAERCETELRRFAPGELAGWRAMGDVMTRARDAVRPEGDDDLWLDLAPSREKIEDRLKGDTEAKQLLFEWSMAEYVERYLDDERLHLALLGQGVIGTNASPFDPGTASINFHHSSGRLGGSPGQWGYVKGGIGKVSEALAAAATQRGVEIRTNAPVSRIDPGLGVGAGYENYEYFEASIIVSNADPRTTSSLLGSGIDEAWRARVKTIPMTGCTVKLNVALEELPNFVARPGTNEMHHRGQINTPLSKDEWRESFARAQAGKFPGRMWTELYFQTTMDDGLAPPGKHAMSVFAQYVPHTFAAGDWIQHREAVGEMAIDSIAQFCSNLPGAVEAVEIKGPPDIEESVGLYGGHIFQGECLPENMWDRRLPYHTGMEGLYLCGACTHPGGSVIAVNGRNAAMQILQDAPA